MERTECLACCKIKVKGKEIDCADEIGKLIKFMMSMEREQVQVQGFSTTQYRCLLELKKAGCLSMNEMSSIMCLEKSTTTRIMDKLVKNEYVTRCKDEKDKRIVKLQLTEKGEEASLRLMNMFGEYYNRVLTHIPKDRVETVIDSLFVFLNAMRKARV
ncbi:MAG: MarR family winged helix-turn-helix transcriptional regulator [Marinifilaceae bacterium]